MIGEISKQKKKRYNLMSNQVYTFLCTLFVAIFYSTYTHKFNINETKNPKRRMPFDNIFLERKRLPLQNQFLMDVQNLPQRRSNVLLLALLLNLPLD